MKKKCTSHGRTRTQIHTQDAAVDMGNLLMKEGFLEHVGGTHAFIDGDFYYRVHASPRWFLWPY
jgi:hypothetical protein